eukprot:768083-Hanusia_phi.AAC.4
MKDEVSLSVRRKVREGRGGRKSWTNGKRRKRNRKTCRWMDRGEEEQWMQCWCRNITFDAMLPRPPTSKWGYDDVQRDSERRYDESKVPEHLRARQGRLVETARCLLFLPSTRLLPSPSLVRSPALSSCSPSLLLSAILYFSSCATQGWAATMGGTRMDAQGRGNLPPSSSLPPLHSPTFVLLLSPLPPIPCLFLLPPLTCSAQSPSTQEVARVAQTSNSDSPRPVPSLLGKGPFQQPTTGGLRSFSSRAPIPPLDFFRALCFSHCRQPSGIAVVVFLSS